MKTAALLLLLLPGVCAGCVSRYNVTLSNGMVITSKGKPRLNADKNTFIFRDVSGQTNFVPAGNVSQISPASSGNDSPTKFNSAVNK